MSGSLTPEAGGSSSPLGDGIDDLAWSRLTRAVSSVSNRDIAGFHRETQEWPVELRLQVQNRISLYLRVLFGYRTEQVLGMRPSPTEVREYSSRIHADFKAFLPQAQRVQVEETLRMCLNMPPLVSKVSAAEFGGFAIVGLGVTVDRPDEQLRQMRPVVAAWWQENLAKIPQRLHLKSD
jgi:hypothetical protein